jgi:hypothetical protein
MGDRIKFFATNFIEDSLTVDLISSSEDASFPASNVQDQFRGKVWRSSGNFKIDGSNNLLVFNDGSDKTILITSGDYTASALASELQTKLNSSSSGFTVTYSTVSLKFTIARTTTFSILWSDPVCTIRQTLGFGSIDDTGASSYLAHELRICWPSEYLIFDIGVSDNPKAIFIIDANNSEIKIQDTATIKLQGSLTNSWNSPESITLDNDNYTIAKININGLFSSGKRFFKVNIEDVNNPTGYIQSGKIYIGDCYEIESTDIQRNFQETYTDLSTIDRSLSGQIYVDENSYFNTYGEISLELCNKTDADFIKNLWATHRKSKPFFVAFDSELKVTDELSEWTKYVRLTSEPTFTSVTCDLYNVSISVEEVI